MSLRWLAGASLLLSGIAFAAAESPFALLEGQEVAASPPLRDLPLQAFGMTNDGSRILAATPAGPALVDDRGQARSTPRCPAADDATTLDTVAGRDGALVAALFSNGRVCVWDAGGPTLYGAPGRDVTHVALGDVDTLVEAHASGLVEGRNPRSGRRRWARDPDLGPIAALRFEDQGYRVAAAAETLGFAVFDTRWGRLVRAGRGEPAFSVAFDPRGEHLAVGRNNGRVEIWTTKDWIARDTIQLGKGRVVDLDYDPVGGQLAAATAVGEGADRVVTALVWDLKTEELVFREQAPAGPGPTRFRYDDIGNRVVLGNGPGVTRLWPRPGARSIPRPIPSEEPPHLRLGPEDFVYPVLTPPTTQPLATEGTVVVAISADAARALLTRAVAGAVPAPPRELAVLDVASGAIRALAGSAGAAPLLLAPDGGHVAAWRDGILSVWDADTGALSGRASVPRPRDVALRGERLAIAGAEGNVATGGVDGRLKVVSGVTGAVRVAIDPVHSTRVGIGTADGEVRIVDTKKTGALGSWGVHKGPVAALTFSPDGTRLASAGPRPGGDGAAVTVLAAGAEELDPWTGVFDSLPTRLDFSPDGERLLVTTPREVGVLDRKLGTLLDLGVPAIGAGFSSAGVAWVDPLGALARVPVGSAALAWVPRGHVFARSDDNRYSLTVDGDRVSVWDDLTGRHLRELPGANEAVLAAAFDPLAEHLGVLYGDRSIEVYEVATGEAIRHLDGPPAGAWLRFSDDGALVWTLAGPREIVGWEVATGNARERVNVPGEGPLTVDTTYPGGRFVRLTDAKGEVWLDTAADPTWRLSAPDGEEAYRPLVVSPKGRLGAVQGGDVVRLDPATRRRVGTAMHVDGAIPGRAAAFSADGAYLVVAYQGGLLRVWDVERGQVAAVLGGDSALLGRVPKPMARLAFDPAGEIVTGWDVDGFPRMWEWQLSVEAPAIGTGAGPVVLERDVRALAISPDGRRLYSAHGDANLRGWNLVTGEQVTFFWGHAAGVNEVVVAAGGRRIVSGSDDGTVRAWDAELAIEKVAVSTFGDVVRKVAASADGWRLAAYGDGGVLRTWDGATGKALRRWRVPGLLGFDLGGQGTSLVASLSEGRWTLDPKVGTATPTEAAAQPGGEDEAAVAVRALDALLARPTAEARAGNTLAIAGDDGRIRLWDLPSRTLRGTLTSLTDGSWVIDRADGTRFASESLRDGTAPLLHKPPPK